MQRTLGAGFVFILGLASQAFVEQEPSLHNWNSHPMCSLSAEDHDGDGWSWEKGQSCWMAPICYDESSDHDGDGWGWENGRSCRMKRPSGGIAGSLTSFSATYYPYGAEVFNQTTCGHADAHEGLYFAVTERSPLWDGECNNDNWANCSDIDCLEKWDRMPDDVKRIVNGQKQVREPACNVPCGKEVDVYSEDRALTSKAVIYDACPSQHWNNRFKEVTEGYNPCAKGVHHVDLRKPLYLKLNRSQENGNIKVWIHVK
jgi:hypothetical protein